MKKTKGSGSGNLAEGLSSKSSFNAKDGGAKPSETGRATKRPTEAGGSRGRIKGRS